MGENLAKGRNTAQWSDRKNMKHRAAQKRSATKKKKEVGTEKEGEQATMWNKRSSNLEANVLNRGIPGESPPKAKEQTATELGVIRDARDSHFKS